MAIKRRGRPKECGDCCACCVGVMLPSLRDAFSGEGADAWVEWAAVRGRLKGNDWYLDSRCSFLEDGQCSIYEGRPHACRWFQVGGDDCMRARAEWGVKGE